MVKLNLFILLMIFVFQSQTGFLPEPPIKILTRITSTENFEISFFDAFCTKCQPFSKTCQNNLKNVFNIPETGHFDVSIFTNNTLNISKSHIIIDSAHGTYQFPNRTFENVQTGYILYIPIAKASKIKGVVVYNHASIFGKLTIPTNSYSLINAIAGLYVVNGYAVLFPNSLGCETQDRFPQTFLLYPSANAKSSVLSLNHALSKLRNKFPQIQKYNLFSVGYSSGAQTALWIQNCVQSVEKCQGAKLNDAYQFRGSAGLDGPYDLQKIIMPFLTDRVQEKSNNIYQIQDQKTVNLQKPSFIAKMLVSYIYYTQGNTNYEQKMNSNFWRMKCTEFSKQDNCLIDGQKYNDIWGTLSSHETSFDVVQSIAHSAFGKSYNNGTEKYLSSLEKQYTTGVHNSVYGLVSKQLLNENQFKDAIAKASTIANSPKYPVFLFSLKKDSVISVNNTQNYIKVHGSSSVKSYYFDNNLHKVCTENKKQVQNVDHNNGELLANLFALSFVQNITNSL